MTAATRDFIEQGRPFKAVWSTAKQQYVVVDVTGYAQARCDDDQDAAEAIADALNNQPDQKGKP